MSGWKNLCQSAFICGLLFAFHQPLHAQPAAPPPPEKYKVELRYVIDSPREQRVVYYKEMIDRLKKLDFEFDPPLEKLPPTEAENIYKDRIKGTIAGENALKIARVPFVESVLLVPAKFDLPQEQGERVLVDLELPAGFGPLQQRELQDQVRAIVQLFDFEESVGYDHRGRSGQPFSRLRGSVPWDVLDILIKDLRGQPAGWFAPQVSRADLPRPYAAVNPIRIIEVLPDPAPPALPAPPPKREEELFDSIGPQLWQMVKANKPQTTPVRIEIVFKVPVEDESSLRVMLQKAAPTFVIEGMLGNIVFGVFGQPFIDENGQTVTAPMVVAEQIKGLARLEYVSAIRLPQRARAAADPTVAFPADDALALKKSGLQKLHDKGHRGQGVKIAIIDSDFQGYQNLIDKGKLPKKTNLIDLTAERNVNMLPDPVGPVSGGVGHGTQCALAAALAAPEAELVLVRIDPAAPYLLGRVLKFIRGNLTFSPSLIQRHDEIQADAVVLEERRQQLLRERESILDLFEDEREPGQLYDFLGPAVRSWLFTPREWHDRRMAEFAELRRQHRLREVRLIEHLKKLELLKDVDIVCSSLLWNDGHPLGGRSALTQMLDEAVRPEPEPQQVAGSHACPRPQKETPLWFQSAGNTRGQTWNDAFRDIDGNGGLEFVDASKKLPKGNWTAELNFLSWLPFAKDELAELPAGTRFRASLQWTEPHDPEYAFEPGKPDRYRQPLADLRIVVVRQRDPEGKMLPADALEVVAWSDTLPQRLANSPNSATYEIFVEWTTDKPGRYALRLERQVSSRWEVVEDKAGRFHFVELTNLVPSGISPLGAPTLPALERNWQLRPRLLVESVSGPEAGKGRPVLDFFTDQGSIGVPADGRELLAIGAARFDDRAEIFSAMGPPADLQLFICPRLFTYSRLGGAEKAAGPAYGASLAAPFAAGMTAALLSSGSRQEVREWLQRDSQKPRMLKIPE